MKTVIAIDSFKGSLSTFEAADAVDKALHTVCPDAEVYISPLADGGEGTVEAIISATQGKIQQVNACGPLGEEICAVYGIIPDGTAVIEMASAAGITLVPEDNRDPLYTTTYGVGELILDAVNKGCRNFIIGLGGSATNDGGAGMLQALGVELLDKAGKSIKRGAIGLKDLDSVHIDNICPHLKECKFTVACDVTNPLCGDNGCSAVFGPQKGATAETIPQMDQWLSDFAQLSYEVNPNIDAHCSGAGAAGGVGFALLAYLNATLKSGIDIVIEATGLEKQIADADIVITGEGRLDGQSYMGKAPIGIARLAKKYAKPVIAFAGCVTEDAVRCNDYGIDAFFPILQTPCTVSQAMKKTVATENLFRTAVQVFRLLNLKGM